MSEPASRERLFLALAVLGFIVPLTLLGIWFADNGLDIGGLLEAAVDNTVALAVLCDVAIASLVFWSWAAEEGPRLGIQRWWLIFPATVFIGLCFALPLFMYWRERVLAGTASPSVGAASAG